MTRSAAEREVQKSGAARTTWKATALEGAVVVVVLVVLGFFYLRPASGELLRGNAAVMVGDGGDSVTNPWQFQLVIDVFKARPWDLVFGAIYSDGMNAPEGAGHFVPYLERVLTLLFAPFMKADLMPTAMAWAYMVLSGAMFYAYARALSWPRAVALALAIAWAFNPFTRARATVHIALVALYWAPSVLLGLHVLARPPGAMTTRRATVIAAALIFFAAAGAQVFLMIGVICAPVFLLYYVLMLPRTAPRVRALGRLALAVLPAALLVVWSYGVQVPSYGARAMKDLRPTRSETEHHLMAYGAHPLDYLAADVKAGWEDVLPLRRKLTREFVRENRDNVHERALGIRWTVLAAATAMVVALCTRRWRRRFSRTERRLAVFAVVLAAFGFAFAMSPQGLRVYETDLGPIQLVAKVFPRFRVPNRIGTMVHLAALLAAGVVLSRVLRGRLAKRTGASVAMAVAVPLIAVVDFLPVNPLPVAPVVPARTGAPLECGYGVTVPYVTWGFHDEDYYKAYASLRGTSCKLLHATYLTVEDDALRRSLGKDVYDASDVARAAALARCTGARWALFRLDIAEATRASFCASMGWERVAPDECRAPASTPPRAPRSMRECAAEVGANGPAVP